MSQPLTSFIFRVECNFDSETINITKSHRIQTCKSTCIVRFDTTHAFYHWNEMRTVTSLFI